MKRASKDTLAGRPAILILQCACLRTARKKFCRRCEQIAAIPLDDGMTLDSSGAAAEAIREETATAEFASP